MTATSSEAPPLVTLHVWGVPARRVPAAAVRMGLDRAALRRTPGLRFAKLLGTGDGRTFTVRDGDPRHWALLATWDDPDAAEDFVRSSPALKWRRIADEHLHVRLRPLASRGRWSGQTPFGDPRPSRHDGPVAAITRARLVPRKAATFWRAVPPVSAALHEADGLRFALGIGEAPLGLQGTFSLWDSPASLAAYAHRSPAHVDAIRRTATEGWYAEELFARFAVLDVTGTYRGRTP